MLITLDDWIAQSDSVSEGEWLESKRKIKSCQFFERSKARIG